MSKVVFTFFILFCFCTSYTQDCELDTIPPIISCKQEIVIQYTEADRGFISIGAEIFVTEITDNCTSSEKLYPRFSLSPLSDRLILEEIPDEGLDVTIWVQDESGNISSCNSRLIKNTESCEMDTIPPVISGSFEANLVNGNPNQNSITLDVELSRGFAFDDCTRREDLILSFSPDERQSTLSIPDIDGTVIDVTVWVTDETGNKSSFTTKYSINADCNFEVGLLFRGAEVGNEVIPKPRGGAMPYTYYWSDDTITIDSIRIFDVPGDYSLTIVDENGCTNIQDFHVAPRSARVRGTLFLDKDLDCNFNNTDLAIPMNSPEDLQVELVKDQEFDTDAITLYSYTYEFPEIRESDYVEGILYYTSRFFYVEESFFNHFYRFPGIETDYKFVKLTSRFDNNCIPTYIPIEALSQEEYKSSYIDLPDALFPIGLNDDCTQLEVSMSSPLLRRCFPNTYDVNYCNYSITEVEDVYLEIELDEYLNLLFSPVSYTDLGENKYRFDIGTLGVGECGNFSLQVEVSCESILGQTHCSKVQIFPESTCDEPDANWSGASLEVEGSCDGEEVTFRISNVGDGNMNSTSNYVVVEDVVMFSRNNFQLNAGEFMEVKTPANGSTYRINIDQVEGHPGKDSPTIAIEGCGTNEQGSISLGFVNQFPENDADRNIDIDCQENIGSYDPNDKLAIPSGIGANHSIEENTAIEYTIRFQNTGTDTAFTVVILDSLSSVLDPSSIQLMSSSHPYQFDLLSGDIMRFRFDNILLPDSTTNKSASNGYVRFKISQDADLVDGTIIENSAAIYFDFNEPIITNTYFHIVGFELSQAVNTQNELASPPLIEIYPNPFSEKALINIPQSDFKRAKLELFDALGTKVWEEKITGFKYLFDGSTLNSGLYFLKVSNDQKGSEIVQLVILE